MKYYLKVLVLLLITLVIWNTSVFLSSLINESTAPNLLTSLAASVIILLSSFYLLRLGQNIFTDKKLNPITFAIINTLFVVIVTLLISIPNQTTKIFFGNWVVYITFISIAIGSYLGLRKSI